MDKESKLPLFRAGDRDGPWEVVAVTPQYVIAQHTGPTHGYHKVWNADGSPADPHSLPLYPPKRTRTEVRWVAWKKSTLHTRGFLVHRDENSYEISRENPAYTGWVRIEFEVPE